MIKHATIVLSKLLVCYLVASLALLVFAMWPYYRLSEMLAILGERLWLIPASLPLLVLVPSMEGNERFIGSLLVFLIVLALGVALAFHGLRIKRKTLNNLLTQNEPPPKK
jgi:hypothetical protein